MNATPGVNWIYPIIGNSLANLLADLKTIHCRAQQNFEEILDFTLFGEIDSLNISNYSIIAEYPAGYEYLQMAMDLRLYSMERVDNYVNLQIQSRFKPQRPLEIIVNLKIKNESDQEWQFRLEVNVEMGKPTQTIVIESLLSKTGTSRVKIPKSFRTSTPFHAYLLPGSASEFSVSPDKGFLESIGSEDNTELPVDIVFAPKMYGKILKAVFVVDTMEDQFVYNIVGKTPDYVPPVITKASQMMTGELDKMGIDKPKEDKKRRNIILENISDASKIKKPQISKQKPKLV